MSGYEALRADIRRLTTLLGQTLVRHGGPELLELVEQVRRLSRSAVASGLRSLCGVELAALRSLEPV